MTDERREKIAQLVADSPWHTLESIGQELGVCRERARQLIGKEKWWQKYVERRRFSLRFRGSRNPINTWRVNTWLAQIGYKYCCDCHAAKPVADFSPKDKLGGIGSRCRRCAADNTRAYYQTERGQAKNKAWKQSERGKASTRAAGKRWRNKHKSNRSAPPVSARRDK